jgi:steroid delta-isomerase-like uncharacterized protein
MRAAVYTDPLGRYEGREAIQDYLEAGARAFPGRSLETTRLIEEGDTAVAEWTFRATHNGPITRLDGPEIPATGKTVEVPGVTVITVRDGKVRSQHDYFDLVGMMTQLGLMPGTE